jgi:hypothetical protein
MFLNKLLSKIGHFFTDLFNGAEKAWEKLSPEVQNAMLQASGIVDIINTNLDKVPEDLLNIINDKFPSLPVDRLKTALHTVAQDLKMAEGVNDADILTLLQHIQQYLKAREGSRWANASDAIAKIIAIVVAPSSTRFEAIASLMVWVYQTFIKK